MNFKNFSSEKIKDKIAIIENHKKFSYRDFYFKILEYKKFLKKNLVKSGEVIILKSNYSLNSISLFFALYDNKNIIVPIISSNDSEIKKKISISGANKLIDENDNLKTLNNKKSNYPDVLSLTKLKKSGLILFSSGSTGEPKGMIHDLDNLVNVFKDIKKRNLNFLVFLMFDHIGGINTMLNIFSMYSTMIIPSDRSPEKIGQLVEKYKVNILPTSPSFLNLMNISNVFKKYDFTSVIMITYGTEPMPEKLLKLLRSKLVKTKFLQTFGTSETGIIKTTSKSSDSLLLKFDDPNQKIKIIDGELWIKSKTKVFGYLNHNNKSFTNDGWFTTGDLIKEYKDGYYKIIGRKSEVINIGGEKVLPIEVESEILSLDFVNDVTVYSQENSILGQIMVANVILNENFSEVEAKKLIRFHCKKNLEKFKIPSKIIFQDKINLSNRFKKIRN